jgi:hypothetical protein
VACTHPPRRVPAAATAASRMRGRRKGDSPSTEV